MKKISTIFLQMVVVFIGVGAFFLLLFEPRIEGRNAHATNFEIYFQDPFLALVYAGSIPFFFAIYQTFKILGYVRENKAFSQEAVKAIQTIKRCALAIIGFVILEEIFIILNHGSDDATGGFFMGVLIIFGAVVVFAVSAMLEYVLQGAVDIKTKNDLTAKQYTSL